MSLPEGPSHVEGAQTSESAAHRGSAHLQLEPARRGGVTNDAGSDTDQLPQDIAAEDGKAATPAVTAKSTHTRRLRAQSPARTEERPDRRVRRLDAELSANQVAG